jgi:phage-related protein
MAKFPTLKTGSVVQYPAQRQIVFKTQVVEFIDGRQQRFREYAQALRRWVIKLDQLDASELQAVAAFFDAEGTVSVFSFTDPWDGNVYGNCVIDGAEFQLKSLDEWRGQTQLTIQENRT